MFLTPACQINGAQHSSCCNLPSVIVMGLTGEEGSISVGFGHRKVLLALWRGSAGPGAMPAYPQERFAVLPIPW